jgi:diguanylate cyclase (GGDEF)-like protein/PAS domain S-box-containing protein
VETSIKGRYNSESQIEVIASSRNIAERKKSDEKAKDSMILLASCLENLKDIIMFAIDRDFNYLYCNRAHKKAMMAAYGTEVEIGMNIIECTKNTDDKINSKINYSHALNGEAISTIQEFGEKSRSYYETFYNPIFGENNEIIGAAVLARDITDRKNRESEILHISFHDKLTGLYNRRFLEEEIIRLDIKRQLPITIVMVDLNSLKVANDTFGHNTGDIIIREAAGLLKKICRSDDILARWGGDEFVILLPKTPIKDAEEIVTRIKKECSKFVVENIPIGFAIGIAAKTKENQDINRTINEAESNMYRNKLVEKASNSSSTILVLEQALREKSNETMEHTIRIRDYALQLGKAVKLPSNQMDEIYLLASLHDIGKVAIPEKILLKKGKLTEKEWAIVKRHPSIGFNIAQSSPQIIHIANLILACHENWDGTGYPQGLKGEEIPIVSRIMFICDSYDVMTSARKYKKPIARDDAIMELKKCSGKQFDPALVKKFIELV